MARLEDFADVTLGGDGSERPRWAEEDIEIVNEDGDTIYKTIRIAIGEDDTFQDVIDRFDEVYDDIGGGYGEGSSVTGSGAVAIF
jgi:hypothetical protein